jgi:hypothetical protein
MAPGQGQLIAERLVELENTQVNSEFDEPRQEEAALAVDYEHDSAYGSIPESNATTSLSSSVLNYVYEASASLLYVAFDVS